MNVELGALLNDVDDAEVRDDNSGYSLSVEELAELAEPLKVLIVKERVQGDVRLYAVTFRERDALSDLIKGKIIGASPKAVLLAAKEYGVGAVQHGYF
jgi:hypothetical protein